jgi:hypothetical protein
MIGFGCQESLQIVIIFPDMQLLMHEMRGIPRGKELCVVLLCLQMNHVSKGSSHIARSRLVLHHNFCIYDGDALGHEIYVLFHLVVVAIITKF